MSAQAASARKVASYTQAITANAANLLAELARATAQSSAPPQPPTANINNEVLRQLENITTGIASIRTDLDLIKTRLGSADDCAGIEESRPEINVAGASLVDLMELEDTDMFYFKIETAEKHNELARRYNSELRHHNDSIAPLHNARNKPVFGFPATLGDLANLFDSKALGMLCGAFGLKTDTHELQTFCGFKRELMSSICLYDITGKQLATQRVVYRMKRATEIEAAGPPTTSTKLAAAIHNSNARRHNEEADCSDYDIKPIHDERNLAVPGFPREWQWFFRPHRRDVLYLLGQYGLDTESKGCVERFEAFAGVPLSRTAVAHPAETQSEWFV